MVMKCRKNGERAGIRTLDLLIKSQLLYRLSYALPKRRSLPRKWRALTDLADKGQLPRLRQFVPNGAARHDFVRQGCLPKISRAPILLLKLWTGISRIGSVEGRNMRDVFRSLVAGIFMVVTFPALADGVASTDAQKTIESQINAFRAGKDAEAYSYAAPSIQGYFPTVESFMAMVKGGYAPVWQPRDIQFGKIKEVGADAVVQEVEIVAKDGTAWVALYSLTKMSDGSWKITGVQLLKADGGSA
jgi:Domain of unknown function (DUF4864)